MLKPQCTQTQVQDLHAWPAVLGAKICRKVVDPRILTEDTLASRARTENSSREPRETFSGVDPSCGVLSQFPVAPRVVVSNDKSARTLVLESARRVGGSGEAVLSRALQPLFLL